MTLGGSQSLCNSKYLLHGEQMHEDFFSSLSTPAGLYVCLSSFLFVIMIVLKVDVKHLQPLMDNGRQPD